MAAFQEDPAPWSAPDVQVEERALEGPHGSIPVRVYAPRGPVRCSLLWVHGGGFSGGSLDMNESHVVAGELAARGDAEVVAVDYRLAGESVRFPVPLDDVHAAWRWLWSRSTAAGIRASLGGASAGAALALATALRERDDGAPAPERLLLAYPFVHFPTRPAPTRTWR
jgi:acetyl esterase/lipase